jgi:Fe-S-cluster containining protein
MQNRLNNLPKEAKLHQKSFKKIVKLIKKRKAKDFDYLMQNIHNEVFAKTDCLLCANCCKTTRPIITEKDLERIAKHLRLKPVDFINQYLQKDTDGLWMFKQTPCVFLDADNYCLIYDVRPKACREYPHLDRSKNIQLLDLHIKNTEICPAVFDAFKILEKEI